MKALKRTLSSLLLIAVSCFCAPPDAAADPKAHEAELAAGAKAEGKLVLYSSPSQQDAFFFLGEFRKQYPFVQTDLYRATSERLITRILTEARGGKVGADAILSDAWDLSVLRDKGILAPYDSPQADAYPQKFREKNNYWTPAFLLSRVIAYNTRQVAAAEAPTRYEDLLAPRYKGRLGMNSEEFELVANLIKIMGEEKGMAFLRALAKQSISFHTGKTLLAELLSAGEVAAVVNVNAHQIEALKRKGAPVEWVRAPFVIVSQDPIALANGAAHPSAGKLFIDWFASTAGQIAVRTVNRIPAHPQVEANPPGLTKGINLVPSDPEMAKDINRYVGIYRSVFGH